MSAACELPSAPETSRELLIEVVGESHARLVAVARQILGSEDEARDAVQDAVASALRALPAFEGRARLSTWLHRITINAALMRLRSRRRRREDLWIPAESCSDLVSGGDDPGVHVERRELLRCVLQALARLPEPYRDAIALRDIEGLDTEEAARLLGLSVGALKTRLSRARRALRIQMAADEAAAAASAPRGPCAEDQRAG